MRLPRNLRMMRGPVDSSALAGTLFLLWMVTLLHSSLVMPPGIRVNLPSADGVLGTVLPQLSLAVDPTGRLLFEQQIVSESNLVVRLRDRVASGGSNQTLLVLMDRSVPTETLAHVVTLARSSGIGSLVLAASPRSVGAQSVPGGGSRSEPTIGLGSPGTGKAGP